MTLEEIKKETLKLMFTNQNNEIDENTFEELLQDQNYSDYLNNMNGCINRAIVRLSSKGIVCNGDRLTANADNSSRIIAIPATETEEAQYLDEKLCELIPYFIKGELYEEEKPQEAVLAKNYFEDCVDDYLLSKTHTTINVVYGMRG